MCVITGLVSLVLLSGCQPDKEDLDTYIAEIKSQQQADIPPIPAIKPYERFDYSAADLRDPFVPTVIDVPFQEEEIDNTADNGISPDGNRRREALEFFSLADLQFVGTLEKQDIWALVRSPDSVIHKVQVGNYMGTNHGQIQGISDTALNLKEICQQNIIYYSLKRLM